MRFEPGLARAEVTLRFEGFLPKRLVPAREGAHAAIATPDVAGAARLRPHPDGEGYECVDLRDGGHVVWRVDASKLRSGARHGRSLRRVGADVVLDPGALLLRPALWPEDVSVSLRLDLPEGVRAAVPWPRAADGVGWRLSSKAVRYRARIALGRMSVDEVRVGDVALEVAVLDAPHRASRAGIRAWLEAAVRASGLLHEGFPARRLLAIVEPVPARDPPVVFGMAYGAGGAHVHLLLGAAAEDAALVGEWVAVHELTHLGLPWTVEDDAWMREGFVTYYQEVLRARAGLIDERAAWQNLHEGFGRGRRNAGKQTLAIESREVGRRHAYHRVYWAGAAIALQIDVALRRLGRPGWSLDHCVRHWLRVHGRMRQGPFRGLDLLAATDRRLGRSVCAPIARAHLESAAFPDLARLYDRLGVRVEAGQVVLADDAPLADLRRAIMAPGRTAPRDR